MRIFIGSSGEQRRLVEWITEFMRREYRQELEPIPWTIPWVGGRYLLENLLHTVDETDACILFWTADDKTWYRDTQRHEPRDNLVFEAGLFIAAHGGTRTQLMIPKYKPGDNRQEVAVPQDVAGMTCNQYDWADGPPEATGLPSAARRVCDRLVGLGPRTRPCHSLRDLGQLHGVEEVRTFIGNWRTIHISGIARLAEMQDAQEIEVLASYRVGEIRRVLDDFKQRETARLRVCLANMWDEELVAAYRRKYHDRTAEHMRDGVKDSIKGLLGPYDLNEESAAEVAVSSVTKPPKADFDIRLTPQRITYSFYRVDDVAFLVPLDMKKAQNPAPLAWVLDKETAPAAFTHYVEEYDRMFREARCIFSNGTD